MYFPKYWIKEVVEGPNREGETTKADAWGWSDTSMEDAREKARMRAQGVLQRLPMATGRSSAYYEDRPFREEILQEVTQVNVRTVITRNSLGCEVLNTDGIGFADLDYDPPRASFFASLFDFGGKKATAAQKTWEAQSLDKLRQWQGMNPSWCFRVYRTAGGLRLLAISKLLKADALETKAWLEGVGSDPLYLKLCMNQKSFRARLTPKPWRCGLKKPPMQSPWDSKRKEKEMQKWLQEYQQKSAQVAVCEYLDTMGTAGSLPECQALVTLHDARTKVASGLPLA